MKEKELNELLDSAIGTKGNLRIPSYWMRKVFSGLMEWCKGLTPDVDVPKKVSELVNDSDFVDSGFVNSLYLRKSDASSTYLRKSDASNIYATKNSIPDVSVFATKEDLAGNEEVWAAALIDLNAQIAELRTKIESL